MNITKKEKEEILNNMYFLLNCDDDFCVDDCLSLKMKDIRGYFDSVCCEGRCKECFKEFIKFIS